MKKYNLREPEFLDERGNFVVKFYKEVVQNEVEEIIDEEINDYRTREIQILSM